MRSESSTKRLNLAINASLLESPPCSKYTVEDMIPFTEIRRWITKIIRQIVARKNGADRRSSILSSARSSSGSVAVPIDNPWRRLNFLTVDSHGILCRTNAPTAFQGIHSSKLRAEEHDLRSIINPY